MSIVPARLDGLSRRIVGNTFADAAIDLFRKIAERRFERLSALVRRSIPERLLTGSFVTSSRQFWLRCSAAESSPRRVTAEPRSPARNQCQRRPVLAGIAVPDGINEVVADDAGEG